MRLRRPIEGAGLRCRSLDCDKRFSQSDDLVLVTNAVVWSRYTSRAANIAALNRVVRSAGPLRTKKRHALRLQAVPLHHKTQVGGQPQVQATHFKCGMHSLLLLSYVCSLYPHQQPSIDKVSCLCCGRIETLDLTSVSNVYPFHLLFVMLNRLHFKY